MLLDIQNRGQLAAGMTSFNPGREQLLSTHKDIGSVTEVFRLSHKGKAESLMQQYAGRAAIGHVRYATCGEDDIVERRASGWHIDLSAMPYDWERVAELAEQNGAPGWARALRTGFV